MQKQTNGLQFYLWVMHIGNKISLYRIDLKEFEVAFMFIISLVRQQVNLIYTIVAQLVEQYTYIQVVSSNLTNGIKAG